MLSSFFNTSKPIHHVILIVLLCAGLCCAFLFSGTAVNFRSLLWAFSMVLTAGVYQFIVSRNELTRPDAFAVLTFVFMLIGLMPYINQSNLVVTLFFITLGMRRLLSLRSGVAVVRKTFDASFWLTCAAILTPGSFLYLILVFLAILFYAPSDHRHWLVPFVGSGCAMVLFLVADLYVLDVPLHHLITLGYSSIEWQQWGVLQGYVIPVLVVVLSAGFIFNYLAGVFNRSQRVLPRFTIITFYALITGVLIVFKGSESLIENTVLLVPIAALCAAQIIERVQKVIYKELIISITLLLCVISFIMGCSSF